MMKKLFLPLVITNGLAIYLYQKYNTNNFNNSYSRFISRKAGQIMNTIIPVPLRETLYKKYIDLYNVNTDEIVEKDLKKYENLKDFFTRKINVIIINKVRPQTYRK
jgi:hypothetical protein